MSGTANDSGNVGRESARRAKRDGRGFDALQALAWTGVVAAIVLASVVNVLSARHFVRWDWTRQKRWSLSPASIETMRLLDSTRLSVDVWAILGSGDRVAPTLRPLLATYAASTPRLVVHFIDPDRDAAQLADLDRRFRLEAGRAEDGRVATDAVLVVAAGEKHRLLTAVDLFEPSDEVHVKPREERALTQALRGLLSETKATLCFTTGHGELSLEPDKDERQWLGTVHDLLQKGDYATTLVDTSAPNAVAPFAGCTVAVIAGPRLPFNHDEATRLRTWLLQGGSLFAVVGPIESSTSETGLTPSGLDEALAPFGIALNDDLVHVVDPAATIPDTRGEGFVASVRTHPITASLVPGGSAGAPRVAVFFARSLRHVAPPDAVWAADLLATSESAYAKRSLVGASTWTDAPRPDPDDHGGPYIVAMASERPRVEAADAHGPRVVVLGSRFALAEDNWKQPRALHGMAFFVDSAVSWLSAQPMVLDVPDAAEVPAGIRITEEGRAEVRRYVLILMPLAAALLGTAVWAWRRSNENARHALRHR